MRVEKQLDKYFVTAVLSAHDFPATGHISEVLPFAIVNGNNGNFGVTKEFGSLCVNVIVI